jgi:UDP-N-acetylglucosamine 2-epimerase (non-hydrolysing)
MVISTLGGCRAAVKSKSTLKNLRINVLILVIGLCVLKAVSGFFKLELENVLEAKQFKKRIIQGSKCRVMLVFGTRPEAVKMAPIVLEIEKSKTLKSIVVSTGQHKELLHKVLSEFGIGRVVDYDLGLMIPKQTLASISARAMIALDDVIKSEHPDYVLVQGDTTTAFMAALVAFYHKIRVGHVEAGLRTRDIYAPFPEEINRQSISNIATFHFAPTQYAAGNLRAEGKSENIFVTGNTVVDALHSAKDASASPLLKQVETMMKSREVKTPSRLLLLTAHRRENFGLPMVRIFEAISLVLETHKDVFVIYPIHLNPEVSEAAEAFFGEGVFSEMTRNRLLSTDIHLNRFLIIPAVNNVELLFLVQRCYFVLTDSGGIQEEAITLGKPVLVLRDTTERPEGVIAGASILVGTNVSMINKLCYQLLSDTVRYVQMSNSQELFGDGHASRRIVRLLEHSAATKGLSQKLQRKTIDVNPQQFDLVVVLTVWKRATTEKILHMIQQQTALIGKRTAIILFQNADHVNIKNSIERWKETSSWHGKEVQMFHIASKLETGYYGRFLGPLTVDTSKDASFIVLDDDILFGNRFFENMLRVVRSGSLATRNGRFLSADFLEFGVPGDFTKGGVDTFNIDDEFDFGGHVWAGEVTWLRSAWRKPPVLLETAEDFWLSAVLKSELGVPTRRPRCPAPDSGGDVELCACSMKIASEHKSARLGGDDLAETQLSGANTRTEAIRIISKEFNYSTVLSRDPDASRVVQSRHKEIPIENFRPTLETKNLFENCLFWH